MEVFISNLIGLRLWKISWYDVLSNIGAALEFIRGQLLTQWGMCKSDSMNFGYSNYFSLAFEIGVKTCSPNPD